MKNAFKVLAAAMVIGMWIAGCHAEGDVGHNASTHFTMLR